MKTLMTVPMKLLVNTVGQLSDGIRLCMKEGLTSGIMLEYVYRNRASGRLILGKILDRVFLSHPGWEGIRQRKNNLVKYLVEAVDKQAGRNGALFLDVASGPALYVADALSRAKAKNVRAICRDMEERWFEKGRNNAAEKGLENIVFEKGDALDWKTFEPLAGKVDICVSSGFYDWIPVDGPVRESMRLIHRVLKPGGYFVFTNQAGHADMDMTNEVFNDFNSRPLKMTTRPQAEVNEWAKDAGFKIEKSVIDKWGYYSVTLARKDGCVASPESGVRGPESNTEKSKLKSQKSKVEQRATRTKTEVE